MKVLVVGGGGREHALVWKIAQSPRVTKIFCAPGNAGISELAECVPIAAGEIEPLLSFARRQAIDLTVVGPEGPLAAGIVDRFEEEGLAIFGPRRNAAELEASKSFAKGFMLRNGIPTARGRSFTEPKEAEAFAAELGAPLVVKADGLAAGKGVIVCESLREAREAIRRILVSREFGAAGSRVVVEECLAGEEASFLALTDGKTVLPLPSAQDHKAIYDGDRGPNTGGMGAYSPAPVVDRLMHRRVMEEIMIPAVRAMAAEGRPYRGVLYAGLMIARDRAKVLEFNARFGDPETQPILMRVKNDLVSLIEAAIAGKLDSCTIEVDPQAAVCVVLAQEGYPGAYAKGAPIGGLAAANRIPGVMVFHAGTKREGRAVVTDGGRVLGVTALGETVEKAIEKAYRAAARIRWDGVYYRKDIGGKAMARASKKALVGIVMGSDSDLPVMQEAAAVLKKFDVPYEMTVASAHRSPARAAAFAESAAKRGMRVIIAGAGHAAHLAGVLAAHTTLPVIGVPIDSSALQGLDALLSTVQMPPGIPVATMAIGKSGARNAGLLAVQMLAISDARLASELERMKEEMASEVERKAKNLEEPR